MTTETLLCDRIARLRDQVMERNGSFVSDANPHERSVALFRARERLSMVQLRGFFLRELAKLVTIRIYPDWRLAGEHLPQRCSLVEVTDEVIAEMKALGVAKKDVEEVFRMVDWWGKRHREFYALGDLSPTGELGNRMEVRDHSVFWGYGWIENHSVRDYPSAQKSDS